MKKKNNSPRIEQIHKIVDNILNESILDIQRFTTGNIHFVYDITLKNKKKYVLRLSMPSLKKFAEGNIYWINILKNYDIPVPKVISFDFSLSKSDFLYTFLERLPGEDLINCYPKLKKNEILNIARERAIIQNKCKNLPRNNGYGGVVSYEDPDKWESWSASIQSKINDAYNRIIIKKKIKTEVFDIIYNRFEKHQIYFDDILPIPFLEDATYKNIIIFNGKIQGVIDLDEVCFGDPLYSIGMTKKGFLFNGYDFAYINEWCKSLQLSEKELDIVNFYTSLHILFALSYLGYKKNNKENLYALPKKLIENFYQSIYYYLCSTN
jgi:hypothetical protein